MIGGQKSGRLSDSADAETKNESTLEEELRPLLNVLLAHVRRARETPLQFGIDSEEIVGVTLKTLGTDLIINRWGGWWIVTMALDKLIDRSLHEERMDCLALQHSQHIQSVTGPGIDDSNTSHPLAKWLDCIYTAMTIVQPRAIEILALRLEGFDDRDIAQRLGMGLRLVKRIIEDMPMNRSVAVSR